MNRRASHLTVEDTCSNRVVDGPRMMKQLEQLAGWTKVSGTPTEAESLVYLSSLLISTRN